MTRLMPGQRSPQLRRLRAILASISGWKTMDKRWIATVTLIDVREDNEWQGGHAASAMHISRWTLSGNIGTVAPDKTARIVLYCLGGVRSAAAAATLQRMGYTNVFSLTGGFRNYQLAGLPIQK
jgi:rhodanese-related sulfurtransferase